MDSAGIWGEAELQTANPDDVPRGKKKSQEPCSEMRPKMEAAFSPVCKSDTTEATKPGFLVLLPRSSQNLPAIILGSR